MELSSIDFVLGGGLFYVVPFEGVCTLLLRITYLTSWCTVILILKKFLPIMILNLRKANNIFTAVFIVPWPYLLNTNKRVGRMEFGCFNQFCCTV